MKSLNYAMNHILCQIFKDIISNFLTLQKLKLLGSIKSKITKNENGENIPKLEITEIILTHCYIVNDNY